ncbi:hypothetical protein ACFXNW_26195 [Nocardia sp. NPDC059180]|uniref:hypothetical protein n=1 Tax=Nocardia sp. NPDC059180 TaxID=3346761 RepID=UPI0036826602
MADAESAHRLMRRHRECRIERCAWKWVAYCTLVHLGRLAPQTLSARERAYLRGIEFPSAGSSSHSRTVAPVSAAPTPDGNSTALTAMTDVATLRQVLDGLIRTTNDEGRAT